MVSTMPSKTACYISILNIIQGDVDPTDVCNPFTFCMSGSPILTCTLGTSIFAPYPRTPTCKLHSMGSGIYSSRSDSKITIYYDKPPCQWSNARKSHQYCLRLCKTLSLHSVVIEMLLLKLFKRMLDQFDRLRKRNAFLEQYRKEKMFEHGLEEFDDARYAPSWVKRVTNIYIKLEQHVRSY